MSVAEISNHCCDDLLHWYDSSHLQQPDLISLQVYNENININGYKQLDFK